MHLSRRLEDFVRNNSPIPVNMSAQTMFEATRGPSFVKYVPPGDEFFPVLPGEYGLMIESSKTHQREEERRIWWTLWLMKEKIYFMQPHFFGMVFNGESQLTWRPSISGGQVVYHPELDPISTYSWGDTYDEEALNEAIFSSRKIFPQFVDPPSPVMKLPLPLWTSPTEEFFCFRNESKTLLREYLVVAQQALGNEEFSWVMAQFERNVSL